MRKINTHKVNQANDKLEIVVKDEAGAGGACHEYLIHGTDNNRVFEISFQNGAINEHGVNGLTQEILIAICIDRLEGFQSGAFACRENAIALTKLQEAKMWLEKRTRDRMDRGVEGTHIK